MTSILVVGSGGREHALAWKLRQSPDVDRLYVAPGNAGTRLVAENVPIAATDIDAIVRFVLEADIDLTIIGPEAPLALGLADRLREAGRLVVGPNAAAARIESSKAFAKDLMRHAGVPTAAYRVCDSAAHAFRHLTECRYPVVVKADGLAAGKGVVICEDISAARRAVESIMVDRVYGDAGDRVVIEDALSGPEISLLAFVDGVHVVPLPIAQDHKRLLDGDRGPNTGGMGAYAPVPTVDTAQAIHLVEQFMEPVVHRLAERGTPYRGILFAGLMLTADGPRVLEYNCRFGDPETQVVLPLLEGDLLPWLMAVAGGEVSGNVPMRDGAAVGVVLAAEGYPETPRSGLPIEGLDNVADDVLVFHAGTALDSEDRIITAGGRVLTIVATGPTIEDAAARAYAAPVWFEGMQRRGDIGRKRHRSLPRIAVLASGDGSNLQALIGACSSGDCDAEIAVVVSHNPEARALQRARAAGIPAHGVALRNRRDPEERTRLEEEVLNILAPLELDLLVLAGWMLVLSGEFLDRCNCPVINVHPALLDRFPIFRGAHAVRDALRAGFPLTGVTVHVVTPEVDAGPVVLSEVVPIMPGDDEESLHQRIKIVEHRLLPQAVHMILTHVPSGGVHA